jgi:hypothetical protein
MAMRISKTLSLTPTTVDSVVYIKVSGHPDENLRRRWNTFSANHCSGTDAFGKYYASKKAANSVVRLFMDKEEVHIRNVQQMTETAKRLSELLLPGEKTDFRS